MAESNRRPLVGRVNLSGLCVPKPTPRPPLVLPPRRPTSRDAYLARQAQERAARLEAIAQRRAGAGLAPLSMLPSVTVAPPVADDPTVRMLLDTFPGAEIVAVRSLADSKETCA